jgi:hypothetical protein
VPIVVVKAIGAPYTYLFVTGITVFPCNVRSSHTAAGEFSAAKPPQTRTTRLTRGEMGRRSGRRGGSGSYRGADLVARSTARDGSRPAIAARPLGDRGNAQNGARHDYGKVMFEDRTTPDAGRELWLLCDEMLRGLGRWLRHSLCRRSISLAVSISFSAAQIRRSVAASARLCSGCSTNSHRGAGSSRTDRRGEGVTALSRYPL